MKNILENYLAGSEIDSSQKKENAGPVITISRECGCSANRIAIKLSKILTGYNYQSGIKKDVEWKWVNKEVIEQAAWELEINPEKIKSVFQGEAKVSVHDVTTAFSTQKVYDADDQKVIDTVTGIIYQMAFKGNCVIVGRGAAIVARDIHRRLSLKLQAPLEWRINRIKQMSNLNYDAAREYVLEVDRQRDLFIEHLAGRKVDTNDFDVVFNTATLTDDQIVNAVVNLIRDKQIMD
ncbi:MAG TPA: cytidylate kinase-like family protein [Prolixibacteraceae bacterium]|nr:cytidylate kinase-like family protein [Prolixibacteraceae bacterium]